MHMFDVSISHWTFSSYLSRSPSTETHSSSFKTVRSSKTIWGSYPGSETRLMLRDQIENLPASFGSSSFPRQKSGFALQRWLDTATTYYEGSVADVGSVYNDGLPATSDSEDETASVATEAATYRPVKPLDDYMSGGGREDQPSNLSRISPSQNSSYKFAEGHTVHGHRIPPEPSSINSSNGTDAQSGQETTMEYEAATQSCFLHNNSEVLDTTSAIEIPPSSRTHIQEGSILRTRYTPRIPTKFFRANDSCLSPDGHFIFYRTSGDIISVLETTGGRVVGKVSVEPREYPGPSYMARFLDDQPGTVVSIPNSGAILVHDGISMPKIYDWRNNSKFKWVLPRAYKTTRWSHLGDFGISPDGHFLAVFSKSAGSRSLFKQVFSARVADPRLSIWKMNNDTQSISLLRDYHIKKTPGYEILMSTEGSTSTALALNSLDSPSLGTVIFTAVTKDPNVTSMENMTPSWTEVFVQSIDQSEWNPRTFSFPRSRFKVSTHPDSPTSRSRVHGEQIFLQAWTNVTFYTGFKDVRPLTRSLPRYTIDGKQSKSLCFDWIGDAEYGDSAPDDDRSFLQILWISSRESLVVTLCGSSQNSSGTDEKLHVSGWHAGNKARIFGPEKIVPKQNFIWHSYLCSADVKGEVLIVSLGTEFWFWRFDQMLEQ